jgi:hypothetical protein
LFFDGTIEHGPVMVYWPPVRFLSIISNPKDRQVGSAADKAKRRKGGGAMRAFGAPVDGMESVDLVETMDRTAFLVPPVWSLAPVGALAPSPFRPPAVSLPRDGTFLAYNATEVSLWKTLTCPNIYINEAHTRSETMPDADIKGSGRRGMFSKFIDAHPN